MGKNYDQDFSILSTGVKLVGKLTSDGNLRVDGDFDGELIINGNLTLGDKSTSNGLIRASNITCGGTVTGIIEASEKLILESSAKVEGDISSKILIINEGASFKGRSNLQKEAQENTQSNE
ncbi:MAG: polymer-forming cytoskeletal protein [Bacteroidetes bacterium]|nr:polymer-forming cytoskeletal protein [Bacteroidota bacterium]MBU1115973.1 polymer-forming cytoskeletal protein [Bacteroidota bacterium]MBU1798430.1 polymer-forming cytoskeletal protein [Bacteroidota bacterium]